jgi:hypothetical protein
MKRLVVPRVACYYSSRARELLERDPSVVLNSCLSTEEH